MAEEIGEVYVISVNISNVKNLYEAYFTLAYNVSFLDAITVSQGSFFPELQSHFDFKIDGLSGLIEVNLSLTNSSVSLNGDGSLVKITFEVTQNSTTCAYSTLNFKEILLLNSESTSISCQSVEAVVFWKSIYDPYMEGSFLDIYTQKAGKGPGELGGTFWVSEVIYLFSEVKYNNWSVPQQMVAFQVINPYGETILVRTAITDQEGIANISFRIPPLIKSIGVWTVISTVSLAQNVIWDITVFEVRSVPTVGGNILPIKYETNNYSRVGNTALYLVAVLTLTLFYTMAMRRRKTQVAS